MFRKAKPPRPPPQRRLKKGVILVKKWTVLLLALILCFASGCASGEAEKTDPGALTAESLVRTDSGYAFPSLPWGASEEEVQKALTLTFTAGTTDSGHAQLVADGKLLAQDGTYTLLFDDDKLYMVRFTVHAEDAAAPFTAWSDALTDALGKPKQSILDAGEDAIVHRWESGGTSLSVSALEAKDGNTPVYLADSTRAELVWQNA